MPEYKISSRELIPLTLLRAAGDEVSGRTRFQKLAFLLDEEALADRFDAYDFIKYDYGPFSKKLLDDLEDLDEKDLVDLEKTRTFGGNMRYDHELTPDGKKAIDELIEQNDEVDEIYRSAKEVAEEYEDYSVRELVELVYKKYPDYKKNSVYEY